MKEEALRTENIPTILWGEKSERVYICVHGKMSCKEEARGFAEKSTLKGYQVISFDLPEHGERINEKYPCMVWNGVHDLGVIGQYVRRNWSDICLYACSLGAYFSLLAYKDLTITKCLFLSPILDMERLIRNLMKWFDVNEQELKEKREIATPIGEILYWDYYCYAKNNKVDTWNAPTAILYGSEDNFTERDIVVNFSKQFNCDLTVLDGGKHWFHSEQEIAFLDKWFDKYV